MALVFKDRVKQKTTTVGSGDLTLIGVDADFQSFSQIGDGNDTYYTIASQNEWEVGVGTYNPSGVSSSWVQLGSDIDGEAAGDASGWSVSLSDDGTIMAIGAINNDSGGSNAGHVRVYEYSSGAWSQKGADIDGEAIGDESGYSVSLSSDGSIVAIGAINDDGSDSNAGHVRVYAWSGIAWVQRGADIEGEAADDNSGHSVSLSSDGSIVAIGAHRNDDGGSYSGHVRVYEYSGGSWSQKGADIDGEAAGDNSGHSVSLSSDGSIVAIGARWNDAGGSQAGHVRVYEWNSGTSAWDQKGSDIDGEATDDNSGYSVSLNHDGTVVAIGAHDNDDGPGSNAGHVRVYEYSGSSWSQKGADIDGEAAGDNSGHSVSLSSDGSIVAIGAIYNDGTDSNAGHVRVYEYSGGSWSQKGADIDGEASSDFSGHSVSLSSDGSIVAIGANLNDGVGSNAGHVRTFVRATLSRNTVLESSNLGNKISTTGTSTVFCTYPAEKSVYRNTNDQIVATASGIVFSNASVQTTAAASVAGSGLTLNSATFDANVASAVQTTAPNSITTTADKTYSIQVNGSDDLVVNVPWTAGEGGGGGDITSVVAGSGLSGGGTTGDVTVNVSGVNTDLLQGTVANNQLANSSVTITAGTGLSNGGSVALGGSVSIDVNHGSIDHDSLNNFVANEHIDHTSVTLTAGSGLAGGGDISTNRTFHVSGVDTSLLQGTISTAQIANDAIDSQHYTDGSIDNAHLADDAVGIAELSATGTASESKYLAGNNSWKTASFGLTASNGGTTSLLPGSIPLYGTTNEVTVLFNGATGFVWGLPDDVTITGDLSVGTIASGVWQGTAIAHAYIGADAIDGDNIADDSVDSEHYVDGSIDTAHIGDDQVTAAKVAADVATQAELDTVSTVANAALPKAGGAMTGAITTNSTFDGVDIATRDGVLTTTTTTANAALPKAGGAMAGAITTNSTFDGRDVATDGTKLDGIAASATVDQTKSDIDGLAITTVGTIDTGTWQGTQIATAYIADNAITLAKLAGGTDGQVITFDANGDPVAVGPGTDGQVLTSTGSGSPPAFEAVSGGGGVDAANGASDRIATFTDSDSLNGEANLTFDGSTLTIAGVTDITDATDSSDATGDTGALRTEGGASIAKKLYVGTDLDVDGTANLDAVDIDGNVQLDGTLTVGVNDTGKDVKFYGATAGSYVEWDESEDRLNLVGGAYVNEAVPANDTPTTEDATVTLDLSLGNYHNIVLGVNVTKFEFTNAKRGQKFTLRITQHASSAKTVGWTNVDSDTGGTAAAVRWAGNITPTMSTSTSHTDVYGFLCTNNAGTTFDGFIIGQDLPD
jgi:hypothetical protein